MSSQLWWYVARSSGLVAWSLAAAAVVWGLVLSARPLGRRTRPAWVLDLHRFVGALAMIFTAVHLAGLVADNYVHFGPAELLVPFASRWRPGAVAWGIVAMYLLLAVEATSVARRHLSKRVWRAVHLTSLPLYLLGTVHALTAGTDTGGRLFPAIAASTTVLIVGLTVLRVVQATRPAPPPRRGPPARPRPVVPPTAVPQLATLPLRSEPNAAPGASWR
jgi:sulfoxide reductase heme-binding subunit YedZ